MFADQAKPESQSETDQLFRISDWVWVTILKSEPDHWSYIIDQVNLNIVWVRFYEYFILDESDRAILPIWNYMIYVMGN